MVLGPSVPLAPGLFSTTMGWPRYFCAISANLRRCTSVEPPGGQGQISVRGLDGNVCAAAPPAHAAAAAASASPRIALSFIFLLSSSGADYSHGWPLE